MEEAAHIHIQQTAAFIVKYFELHSLYERCYTNKVYWKLLYTNGDVLGPMERITKGKTALHC